MINKLNLMFQSKAIFGIIHFMFGSFLSLQASDLVSEGQDNTKISTSFVTDIQSDCTTTHAVLFVRDESTPHFTRSRSLLITC